MVRLWSYLLWRPPSPTDTVGESEPKPRGCSVEVINPIPFVSVLLNFSFKIVVARIPNLTWLADPSQSPVYSDIFNYLIKTFGLCCSF